MKTALLILSLMALVTYLVYGTPIKDLINVWRVIKAHSGIGKRGQIQ